MDKTKRMRFINIGFTVVVLILATVLSIHFGSNKIDFSLADSTLTVTGPDKFSYSVKYENINKFIYLVDFDKGEETSGGTKRKINYGSWVNGDLGTYNLCVSEKINTYIYVESKSGDKLVFNYDDAEFTLKLYNTLKETFEKNNYSVIYE